MTGTAPIVKESRLRPPGQTSTSDLLSESSTGARQSPPTIQDPSRVQSIQSLVFKLSSGTRENDSASTSQQVVPLATTAALTTEAENDEHAHVLDSFSRTANHEAIVKHFHLRRVLEDEHNATEDDGDGDNDNEAVDGSSPYAQRMVNAAKIHEFRRMKSRRDSRMASMVTFIPVSKRRMIRRLRRIPARFRQLFKEFVTPFKPTGTFSKVRGLAMLIAMLIQLFLIPFAPVYYPKGTGMLDGLGYFFDVVYIIDFLASCNTAYYGKPEQLEFSRRKILLRYIRTGWPFWLDLVSSVPIDTIIRSSLRDSSQISQSALSGYVMIGELHSIIRFFSWGAFLKSIWFMRVVRATKEFWFRVVYSRLSYALAVAKIILMLLYAAHYIACFWRFTLISSSEAQLDLTQPWKLYIGDLYYGAQLLQGQGAPAANVSESIFGSIAVLFGYLAIAFIISWVSLVLINSHSNSSLYQRKLEMVFATMDKMQLPPQLRRRIHQYYNHLWFEHDSIDGDIAKFSHELSPSLRLEVRLFKYMDLVLSVSYWRNSSADFVTQIMLSLDVRAYLPEDYIVRQGEVGAELFLINRGVCELTSCPAELPSADGIAPRTRHTVKTAMSTSRSADNAVNVRRLMAGHSFGELALLMNYRRTADVRALTYVEMCVLNRRCFQKLLIRYREDRQEVLRELVLSCIEKSGMRFIAFPWEDMVDRILCKGTHRTSATSHTQLTPWEAADLIVELITPESIADDSVTFGFHDFDSLSNFQLTPITMADRSDESVTHRGSGSSSCACRVHIDKITAWQQQTVDRLASLECLVGELVDELRDKRTKQ